MSMRSAQWAAALPLVAIAVALGAGRAAAEQKFIRIDRMTDRGKLEVAADGSRVYIGSSEFLVFDDKGNLLNKIGYPSWGTGALDLYPLPDGWFIRSISGLGGQIALCRPDGSEARVIVDKGNMGSTTGTAGEKFLRHDMTGWTSPRGCAVDPGRKIVFALDCTMPPNDERHLPNPDWSRIAMWDFDGKYLGDINRFDAYAPDAKDNDARRMWYRDIEVDASRQRVYVTTDRSELMAFGYDGKLAGRVKVDTGGESSLAVFPDGRLAAGGGDRIELFDADLKPLATNRLPAEVQGGITDLEADGQGRLYATVNDPAILYIRWAPDLSAADTLSLKHLRICAEYPATLQSNTLPFTIRVKTTGVPVPTENRWQVMVRPTDGRDLRWQKLNAALKGDQLEVAPPAPPLDGFYEVAVRYGDGPIAWNERDNDPYLQRTVFFLAESHPRSLALIPAGGRRAYRQGEAIPIHLVRRDVRGGAVNVQVRLEGPGLDLPPFALAVEDEAALEVPAALTRRLSAGTYTLRPAAEYFACYPLTIEIAPAAPDSPMQRIMYHEFGQAPVVGSLADTAERQAYLREYARAAARLGFTRETDRAVSGALNGTATWHRDGSPVPLGGLSQAPAEYYAIPSSGGWETEFFNDQAVKYGLSRDSQLLGHCSSIRFRDVHLQKLDFALQQFVQWASRWPSFYGVNYNDECFLMNVWDPSWTKEDTAWIEEVQAQQFKGRPGKADAYRVALCTMYGSFNAAVRQANPDAKITTTPMWQFPAVDGSYAPDIYKDMSESYSHFLSEGMHIPWYPAHSVEFLRRPGLPLMGVFDNGYADDGGAAYAKNAMQVLARGVQGVGVEHTAALANSDVGDADPQGADVYRTVNLLAAMYGAVFAQARPANEAAVLYSYEQDITEARNCLGTPHWERVYALLSAGLMAGVPMGIAYEEDIAGDWLLDGRQPRVPMLFLVGQTQPLPAKVRDAIARYRKAGGRVFTDTESAALPGAVKLGFRTSGVLVPLKENYCVDSWFSTLQPVLARLAQDLKAAVAPYRRYPLDSDDLWVSKNAFDGGAIRYVMLANETAPYPWDAGTVWSMGMMYNKTWLPRTVSLTLPAAGRTIYDVFDHARVEPKTEGSNVTLRVNLRTFPGRLYAVAPAALGAPRIETAVQGDTLRYRVTALDQQGGELAALVPLRIRLLNGQTPVLTLYRGTDVAGRFQDTLPLPLGAPRWTIEVTELLGGLASASEVSNAAPPAVALAVRPQVEFQREDRIRSLLADARTNGVITLVLAETNGLTMHQKNDLATALKAQGLTLQTACPTPTNALPGVYLTASCVKEGRKHEALLSAALEHGLFASAVSQLVPGPGRGFVSAAYAPRRYGENAIALVAGDDFGLSRTVDTFVEWLRSPPPPGVAGWAMPALSVTGKPVQSVPLPRLREMTGVKLGRVTPAADGKHLLLSAPGFMKNLALLQDDGNQVKVVRTARVAQTRDIDSLYVSPDGKAFGAAGGLADRIGEGFHLVDAASGETRVFAAFGTYSRSGYRYAVSAAGDTVVTPGTYGVVCWRRAADGKTWKESWSIDYWKEFNALTWDVSAEFMRIPQFSAYIPAGADYALIVFGEFRNNGWVTAQHHCKAWVAAVDLATGAERWRFDVPIADTQLFPKLIASENGTRLLLQVQMGSWGKETYRFYSLDEKGGVVGTWDAKSAPQDILVADGSGAIAELFKNRLLALRDRGGKLIYSRLWDGAGPVSAAFAADGQSLIVADDAGRLALVTPAGEIAWQKELGGVVALSAAGGRVFAAGWDGRLRSYDEAGNPRWALDCTPVLDDEEDPLAAVAALNVPDVMLCEAQRASTIATNVPAGANLLAGCSPAEMEVKDASGKVTGKQKVATNALVTIRVGGVPGWLSRGLVTVKPEQLVNGRADDVAEPWIPTGDVFQDAAAGRQAWVEIAFREPTDVKAVTVYESTQHPESWPIEGQVQNWDEAAKKWVTVVHGVFMHSPVSTYSVDLKQATKIRYVPWHSYYRNFYTCEIEVR